MKEFTCVDLGPRGSVQCPTSSIQDVYISLDTLYSLPLHLLQTCRSLAVDGGCDSGSVVRVPPPSERLWRSAGDINMGNTGLAGPGRTQEIKKSDSV